MFISEGSDYGGDQNNQLVSTEQDRPNSNMGQHKFSSADKTGLGSRSQSGLNCHLFGVWGLHF